MIAAGAGFAFPWATICIVYATPVDTIPQYVISNHSSRIFAKEIFSKFTATINDKSRTTIY